MKAPGLDALHCHKCLARQVGPPRLMKRALRARRGLAPKTQTNFPPPHPLSTDQQSWVLRQKLRKAFVASEATLAVDQDLHGPLIASRTNCLQFVVNEVIDPGVGPAQISQ